MNILSLRGFSVAACSTLAGKSIPASSGRILRRRWQLFNANRDKVLDVQATSLIDLGEKT